MNPEKLTVYGDLANAWDACVATAHPDYIASVRSLASGLAQGSAEDGTPASLEMIHGAFAYDALIGVVSANFPEHEVVATCRFVLGELVRMILAGEVPTE